MKDLEYTDIIIRAEEILDNPISFNQMKDIVYYIEEEQKVEGTSIKCKCGIELVCTKKTKNLEAWKVKEGEEIC